MNDEGLTLLYNRLAVARTAIELNRQKTALVALDQILMQLIQCRPGLFPYVIPPQIGKVN